jgi:hypothetical protein
MKFCKDCRHFTVENIDTEPRCEKGPIGAPEPVFGKIPFATCAWMRSPEESCGPGAKLFEPIEQPTCS